MSTLAIENRRANRRLANAIKRRPAPVTAMAATSPWITELTAAELIRIKQHLLSLACTEAWAEAITDALLIRKPNGRRMIPYAISEAGTLRTKIPRLIEMITDANVYPPAADDVEFCAIRPRAHHQGSQMLPCYCRDCNGLRLWPSNYIQEGWISYTCSVNRREISPDVDPQTAGGYAITIQSLSQRMVLDPDAWRRDLIDELQVDVTKVKRYRWGARRIRRLGALADYLDRGHDLADIVGIDAADEIQRAFDAYSRAPRMVGVRVVWQKTKLGRRK